MEELCTCPLSVRATRVREEFTRKTDVDRFVRDIHRELCAKSL